MHNTNTRLLNICAVNIKAIFDTLICAAYGSVDIQFPKAPDFETNVVKVSKNRALAVFEKL